MNGQLVPDTLRLVRGTTYRFRLVNMAPDWRVVATVSGPDGGPPLHWRAVAKDGAELPAHQATMRPARLIMGTGETADFEFTPTADGPLALDVATQLPGWTVRVPLQVREPDGAVPR